MEIEFLIENKGILNSLIPYNSTKEEELVLKKTVEENIRFGTFNINTIVYQGDRIVELRLSSRPTDRAMNTVTLHYVYHREEDLWYPENILLPDTTYTSVVKLKESLEIFFLYLGYKVEKTEDVSTLSVDGKLYPITHFMDNEKNQAIQFQGKSFDMEKELTQRLEYTVDLANEEWIQIRERFASLLFKTKVPVKKLKYKIEWTSMYSGTMLLFLDKRASSLKEEYRNKECPISDYIDFIDMKQESEKKREA